MISVISYLKSLFIAGINFINAIVHKIVQVTIDAPYAYLSTVWAGTEDPLWLHLIFVPGSVLAGIVVGVGIVLERPKYSEKVHNVAFWLVVVGIAIESLCTVSLFIVDERISNSQQAKIILLEKALQPRRAYAGVVSTGPTMDQFEKLKEFQGTPVVIQWIPDAEAGVLANDITFILNISKWQVLFPGDAMPNAPIGTLIDTHFPYVLMLPAVEVYAPKETDDETRRTRAAAEAIADLLSADKLGIFGRVSVNELPSGPTKLPSSVMPYSNILVFDSPAFRPVVILVGAKPVMFLQ